MPRVFEPGLPSHVWIRGNDRRDIVECAAECRRFLADLDVEARTHGMSIHAYVLMTNHVHLLVTGQNPASVPRAIQGIGRRYVPYFNLRHGRSGTLWEGRYKCSPIASDGYLFTCHRYIELNPVRARMVTRPGDYRWSSHAHYVFGVPDPLVTPHPTLNWTSGDRRSMAALASLFDEGIDETTLQMIRSAACSSLALGDEADCRALEARLGVRVTPRPIGRRAKDKNPGSLPDQLEMMV